MSDSHKVPVGEEEYVAADHHPADSERWLFLCHGFASNKEGSYATRASSAAGEGFNAVRFDFRGCGESEGVFSEQNLSTRLEDLVSVVEYFGPESYVLFGSSFGGKVALHHAASAPGVEAVVGRAPLTYLEPLAELRREAEGSGEMTLAGRRVDPGFFDDLWSHPFGPMERGLDSPVAFFHGREDDVVEMKHTWRVAEALEPDVLVHAFEGEGHVFSREAEEEMMDLTFAWLSRP